MAHQRSRHGEHTTAFEQALLASAESSPSDTHGLLVECARRVGADAFAHLLDFLGGGTLHLPNRRDFFDRLARAERNARIFDLLDAGKRPAEIAELLGVPEGTVRAVIFRAPSEPCNAES